MTDISDLREGDEIEATIRMRLTSGYFTDSEGGIYPRYYLDEVAAITVVRPEIIPGKPSCPSWMRHSTSIRRANTPTAVLTKPRGCAGLPRAAALPSLSATITSVK